ncbi:hypothetical protein [Corallococcus sp. AS-1-12]|uniref:hypothetical protein n=1 Tax=Corallococcus sp. AS-1-12 TaxID=2874598 RepID=UPI001CBA7B93|nr:hypothetical protein [Corallococcus sp. AS-1-12]MBZ4334695.1 hypothetical protein [Corallococcus sp. AS-1-12]
MSGIGKPKDEEVTEGAPRDVLRGIYSQLFKMPVPAERMGPADQDPGIQAREEMCKIVRGARGSTANDMAARADADAKLHCFYVNSGFGTAANTALSCEQWTGLKAAFSPTYAMLHDVQVANAMVPNQPDSKGILEFGPYELALLYHWLFSHKDCHQAHNYLHALKTAARTEQPESIIIVLGVLFNDRAFTKFHWPEVTQDGQKARRLVTLKIDEMLVRQMGMLLTDERLAQLEPYEDGGVCAIDAPSGKDFCY